MNKLKELQKEEKRLFDTYKQNKSDLDKINHLRKMADLIEKIHNLKLHELHKNAANEMYQKLDYKGD